MVSHRHRVHPVTRQGSRSINRRQLSRRSNTFSRIRVLTTAEINRQTLNIDIESGIEPVLSPLLRAPAQFHGAGSPTHDIVEYPLQSISENQILSTLNNDDNRSTILLEEDLFEDKRY